MPKVSIITPCYNSEEYISRYIDSVLAQTYDKIELILVNDGSTDKTEEMIFSYKDKLEKRGYELIYIKQENQGQASAVNNGLKKFTGDYLTWPDSDDFLTEDSIEKKVRFLEENLEYGFVRTDSYICDENDLQNPIGYITHKRKDRFRENLFLDFLLEKNIYFAPGCYMVRVKHFLTVNPSRDIYTGRGQNWQMLLPLSYKYKGGYIDEPLFTYVVRANSQSHLGNDDLESELKKESQRKNTLINVIKGMDLDQEYYLRLLDVKYIRRDMRLAIRFLDKKLAYGKYGQLKKMKELTLADRMYKLFGVNRFTNHFERRFMPDG